MPCFSRRYALSVVFCTSGALFAGCATGPSTEQLTQQLREMPLDQYLSQKSFKAVQADGKRFATRVVTQDMAAPQVPFLGKRQDIRWVENVCTAQGGKLNYLDAGDVRALGGSATAEERIYLMAYGGSHAAQSLQSKIEQRGAGVVGNRVASSLLAAENAGRFICQDAASAAVSTKWQYVRTVIDATNGFRGAFLSVPEGSRLTIQETFVY